MIFPQKINMNKMQEPYLITIPYSHYCELARWVLDISKTQYKEMKYIPVYHAQIVGKLRKKKENRSNSSFAGQESGHHGGRRKYSVPLVVMPNGIIYKDSWEILETFFGAVDKKWKEILDNKIGIATRQLAYYFYLDPKNKSLINNIIKQAITAERLFWFLFEKKIRKSMYELMAMTETNIETSKKIILEIFEQASKRLELNPYSITEESNFSPTDLAFCALGSIVILPKNYSRNLIKMANLEDHPDEYKEIIKMCRATKAG
ncbi:hypothetical protein OAK75_01770 [Bacteriovoracales bacterium]|nr:hypothetical protein [Bacteriovoracales bacterium]